MSFIGEVMIFLEFIKYRIILFAVIVISIGYFSATGFDSFVLGDFVLGLLSAFFIAAGALGLNEVQEWQKDKLMIRTQNRPIPRGSLTPKTGLLIALCCYTFGILFGALLNITVVMIGVLTFVLYNGLYTEIMKPKTPWASIVGIIPGAFPVLIGYAASGESIFSVVPIYLFLIVAFWQIPHYGALAIKYNDDYKRADFPVLPVVIGVQKTIYLMGFFMVLFIVTAIAYPLYFNWSQSGLYIHIPLVIALIVTYLNMVESKQTMRYFMVCNFSMLGFIATPLLG